MEVLVVRWSLWSTLGCFEYKINYFFPLVEQPFWFIKGQTHWAPLGMPKWVWPSKIRYKMLVQTFKLHQSRTQNVLNMEGVVCKTTTSGPNDLLYQRIYNCSGRTQKFGLCIGKSVHRLGFSAVNFINYISITTLHLELVYLVVFNHMQEEEHETMQKHTRNSVLHPKYIGFPGLLV